MRFETKVCLSSLLLRDSSPEEAGLTPECFPSFLEGNESVWATLGPVSLLTV